MKKIISFIIGLLNGVFGAGAGALLVPFLKKSFNLESKKAHATSILIILIVSIITTFTLFLKTGVNLKEYLFLATGGVIGGLIAGTLLKNIQNKWLTKIFALILIVVGGRMLF
ncbi:MAG: TSUP family transporter [Lachnospirales bacterium]